MMTKEKLKFLKLKNNGLLLTFLLFLSLFLTVANVSKVQAQEVPDKVVLDKFPVFAQWYNLSCEYSATRMITAYYNREINDTEFIRLIGYNSNPHIGFRGNINGWFGGTWDYGIYAEPLAKALNERGFKTKLLVGGAQALKLELAKGRPVQVWTIAGMGWSTPFTTSYENLPFKLAGGEHSLVAYGYDGDGVYIADPAYGTKDYYSWNTFLRSWSYFDYMAMSVWVDDSSSPGGEIGGVSPYFYRHWLNAGGLPIYGYPIAEAQQEGSKVVQYFERARLEYDLNGSASQPINVGLLGRELTAGRTDAAFANTTQKPDALFFNETQHNLTGDFRAFWESNGGLNAFGFPIGEDFSENGKVVQYFERVRFEWVEPGKVSLGLLGVERLNRPTLIETPSRKSGFLPQ